ncbi:hypothetical protein ACFWYW_28620 [Nonomuraea sp. NPDC059023]|uniref:hypothetical protein n=1 Tax=unclassified Nonomuraea TaxID=2593643 RepID=UPI00367D929B
MLAPGPADARLQYIDVRDADWLLRAAERGLGGAYTAIGRPRAVTTKELPATALDVTGFATELVWAPAGLMRREGLTLGLYLPDGSVPSGMHDANQLGQLRQRRPIARHPRVGSTAPSGSRAIRASSVWRGRRLTVTSDTIEVSRNSPE